MAALDYTETKELVSLVLNRPAYDVRTILFRRLSRDGKSELLSRLPNRILHSGLDISHILSEEQRARLPPTTG